MPDLPNNCWQCGYDLRGQLDGWKSCCPIEIRCPECGHAFETRRLFTQTVHPASLQRRVPGKSLIRFMLACALILVMAATILGAALFDLIPFSIE